MIFDRYMFRNLVIATVFVAITLAAVIFLTQSLRFLELVINSGASSASFWILTLLALPRFFEIILPIAAMAATAFVYNKMIMDSELVVMRGAGVSTLALARPALALAGLVTAVLWVVTMWLGPASLSNMQQMRQVIKAQYSTFLFREGVFNAMIPGLTVYIREKDGSGELRGIMIHDSRAQNATPVTVIARRGAILATDEGQQVLVYDGSRQSVNPDTGALERLDFDRYTIDLPEGSGPVRQRWREPDERSFFELLSPDPGDARAAESRREFIIEAHRRVVSPLLAPAFVMIVLSFLLLGHTDRRGQGVRIALAALTAIVLQGLYLGAFSLGKNSVAGLLMMYLLVFAPMIVCGFLLGARRESVQRTLPPKAVLP